MPPAERDASPYRERFGARAVPHWMTTDATAVAPQSLNAGSMHSNNEFAAVLFDMEGTILISIGIAERIWAWWAESRGIDPAVLLPTIHGVRAVETISRLDLPGIDAEAEADRITQAEIAAMDGIEPIPGVAAFIGSLPTDRWAVVTSAPRALAERRIEAAGLPMPAILIAAEDVAIGKPAPDYYLLAAARLGVLATEGLVFEDAPAGVAAAEAAGASIILVTAYQERPFTERHPATKSFDRLRVRVSPGNRLSLWLA